LAAVSRAADPVRTRSVAELVPLDPDPVLARGAVPDVVRPLPVSVRSLPVAGRAAAVLVPDDGLVPLPAGLAPLPAGLVPLPAGLVPLAAGLVLPVRAEPAVVFAAPDAGLAELDAEPAGPDSERIALRVARARPPTAVAVLLGGAGSTVQLRNMKYCWPRVHTLVVTQ